MLMSAWILWCVLIWALSSLACSMSKHQRDVFNKKVSARQSRIFQGLGWGLLAISVLLMMLYQVPSIGISEWLGCLSFAALMVGLTLTYLPKKLMQLNMAVTVLFLILIAMRL
jgi:hypothetical protein